MGLLQTLGRLFRETRDVLRLQELTSGTPRVVAYAEDAATWLVLGPFLEQLVSQSGAEVSYLTSAADDPLFERAPAGIRPAYVARTLATLLPRVGAAAFLTTMPDLGKLHIPRPPAATPCVYAFHSLISTHEGYRPGAFDHYDVFFCAGPHHKAELEAYFRRLGRAIPELLEVGYPKLDRLAARYAAWQRPRGLTTTVLVAPSWGKGNVLEAAGVEVVSRLRASGLRVIVRPHPCFWLPIYPGGRTHVQRVIDAFATDREVIVERSIDSESAFLEADLLVSDYSGAAYEYAFATRRPVLFFDGARKTLNPDWRELGLPAFEDVMRSEVGELLPAGNVGAIEGAAARLLRDGTAWAERLDATYHRHVYHPGHSAEAGAQALSALVSRRASAA
jgi:YidC/Oxa1 family membrane protein insertase